MVVVTLMEVELADFECWLLPRWAAGEVVVAGAALISPSPRRLIELRPAASASYPGFNMSLYREYLSRRGAVDGLDVLPSPVPNSAVFAEMASILEAAPDEWAVEGALNSPPKAESIADPIYG